MYNNNNKITAFIFKALAITVSAFFVLGGHYGS